MRDRGTGTVPLTQRQGGVRPRLRPPGVCPPERNDGRHTKPVLDRHLAALPLVDELGPGALSPRRPFAPILFLVRQAWVWICSPQIHAVHALRSCSNRPLGIPLPYLHLALLLPSLPPHFLLAPQSEHPLCVIPPTQRRLHIFRSGMP